MKGRDDTGSWPTALADRFGTKRRLIGCSILRLGLGGMVSYLYVSSWPVRHLLWGPRSVVPIEAFESSPAYLGPSVFAVRSEPLFDVLFAVGLALSVAFLLGWRTRWVVVPFVVFTWSLFSRNPLAMNAANTLVAATLIYFVFLDSSSHLSLDARRGRNVENSPRFAWLHNASLLCLLVQLCIVYAGSFIFKLLGSSWREGTALLTIFSLAEYRPPIFAGFLTGSRLTQSIFAYMTMAVEAAYPLLVWSRRGRVLALLGALMLHGGTIFFMGLVSFGLTMIAFQAILLSDDQYRPFYPGYLSAKKRV